MKVKTVKRYYCDFCKKSGGQPHAMRLHEAHCTLNPNRLCRMCKAASGDESETTRMPALLATMPPAFIGDDSGGEYSIWAKSVRKAMPKLRVEANNCPACTLATLRQIGASGCAMDLFDYKAEVQGLWADVNAEKQEQYDYL